MKISRKQKIRGRRIISVLILLSAVGFLIGGIGARLRKGEEKILSDIPHPQPPKQIEEIFGKTKSQEEKKEMVKLPSPKEIKEKAEKEVLEKTNEIACVLQEQMLKIRILIT